MQKVSTQQGFTLIELIIVIVLLGILAVTAAPKFLNLQDDARDSVLEGIAGSLESASSIIYGKALVQDQAGATGTVELNSTTSVTTVFGYPNAEVAANFTSIVDYDTAEYATALITADPDSILVYYTGFGDYENTPPTATTADCTVVYTNPEVAGERPDIFVNTCVQ
jgi:MSHA pilin protein MshA